MYVCVCVYYQCVCIIIHANTFVDMQCGCMYVYMCVCVYYQCIYIHVYTQTHSLNVPWTRVCVCVSVHDEYVCMNPNRPIKETHISMETDLPQKKHKRDQCLHGNRPIKETHISMETDYTRDPYLHGNRHIQETHISMATDL